MQWLARLSKALGISPKDVRALGHSKHSRAKQRRKDHKKHKKTRRLMARQSRKINRHK